LTPQKTALRAGTAALFHCSAFTEYLKVIQVLHAGYYAVAAKLSL